MKFFVSALIAVTYLTPICRAEDLARLFVAQRENSLAFFLPIAHIASTAEINDRYLDRVIRPAYKASTQLLDEFSSLDPSIFFATCSSQEISDVSIDYALNEKFSVSVKGTYWDSFHPALRDNVGRFVKFWEVYLPPPQSHPDVQISDVPLPVQAILLEEEWKPHNSIENSIDVFNAYCSLSVTEREFLIRHAISRANDLNHLPDYRVMKEFSTTLSHRYVEALKQARITLNTFPIDEIRASNEDALANDEKEANDKFVLGLRTKNWIKKIDEISHQSGTAFYALGAAHFADGPHWKGLFTRLKEDGYILL
ncbi:TraB/GumN family protein [Collimonas fungivorans]|uniref:TraB/GumN family protein n=1 Tax=Collimonas fungivorans TaxID=158899 RepID=UPI003FA3A7B8